MTAYPVAAWFETRDVAALLTHHLKMIHFSSWPGFVPAIHVFLAQVKLRGGCPAQAGHDELRLSALFHWLLFGSDSEEARSAVSKDEATAKWASSPFRLLSDLVVI
jgi:hypothetical protein